MGRVHDFLTSLDTCYRVHHAKKVEISKIKEPRRQKLLNDVVLSTDQKNAIDSLYAKNYGKKIPYDWHRLYTSFTGNFDPRYIPELIFIPEIQEKFIDRNCIEVFSDKNLIPLLVEGVQGVRSAEIYLSYEKGCYRNRHMEIIDAETAIRDINNLGECFIKPTIDSNSGRGCAVLNLVDGVDTLSGEKIADILKRYGGDFNIQELLHNCDSVSNLHPKSINTFRVTSYIWNGEVQFFPLLMRIGRSGNRLDNAHQGGIFVGVRSDGKLKDCAYTEFRERFYAHPDTGIVFGEYSIPEVPQIYDAVKKLHSRIVQAGMISWDVTIDNNGEIVIIELNLDGQTIWLTQMANGEGAFGENTEEILPGYQNKKTGRSSLAMEKRKIKMDTPFFIYFLTMMLFYTKTYIQLAAQLGIILYVFAPVVNRNFIISKRRLNNTFLYCRWFVLFCFLFFLSTKFWAYSTLVGSKTMLTIFRIAIIGFCMFYYVDNGTKAKEVFKSFLVAFFIMSFVALLLTPVSNWGKEAGLGVALGHHRNGLGAISAPLVLLCYCFGNENKLKYSRFLIGYFTVYTLLTGSRSSILQLVIILMVHMLINERNFSKWMRNALVFALIGIIAIIIVQNIPFLHATIWVRIQNSINTILGGNIVDSSTLGREYYKDIAFIMFLRKPIWGYGLDGFSCFVRDNPRIMGVFLNNVYAHCNYAEIAADLGIIGLIVWYIPVFQILKLSYSIKKCSKWCSCLFATFFSMVLLDYSRIPWETHLIMYFFFTIIMLIRFQAVEESTLT